MEELEARLEKENIRIAMTGIKEYSRNIGCRGCEGKWYNILLVGTTYSIVISDERFRI